MEREYIEPKRLFDEIEEGDQVVWDDREQPVTVVRHVTEDDVFGQLASMYSRFNDEEEIEWLNEHQDDWEGDMSVGGLLTGDLTGDEFLILRGPRGGCYAISIWWKKHAGQWYGSVARYRRNRKGAKKGWSWENTGFNLYRVGHTDDYDRDVYYEGVESLDFVPDAEGRTIWESAKEGTKSEYDDRINGRELVTDGGVTVEVGQTFDTGSETVEITNELERDGVDHVCVYHHDREPVEGSTYTVWRPRASVEAVAAREGWEHLSDSNDDESDYQLGGEFIGSPRCPRCARFMRTGYEPDTGFPIATCQREHCGGVLGVSELIDRGYYEE